MNNSTIDFLADCAAWHSWLEKATPEEIEKNPATGHLRIQRLLGAMNCSQLQPGGNIEISLYF
jgi:hypothetical protein